MNLVKVCEEFHDLVEENAPVLVSGLPNDDGTGRMTVYDTDDGLQLLSIYSCGQASEEAEDETKLVVGLQDLVVQALSSGIDGISIDADTDQMRMVVFSEILREILKNIGIPDPAVYS